MRHLNWEAWFDAMGGRVLRGKRVSAAAEAHFPKKYRQIYQQHGPSRLVKVLMEERHISLHEAWAEVKRMFNEKPKG